MKKVWRHFNGNSVLDGKGFYISYNPDPSSAKNGLGAFYNQLGGIISGGFLESDGRAETAIVKPGAVYKYYILNGDFRADYEKLVDKGFMACKKFFLSKPECKSNWSTD